MINFEKYIKEALYDFDFFIVPGFGAFIASFAQASIDESGLLIEPSKSYKFNGLLTVDEGKKFVNYVLNHEHKPISEVEQELKKFTFELKSSLNKNDKVVLVNDCVIVYDQEKKILKGEFNGDTNYYRKPDFGEPKEANLLRSVPVETEVDDILKEDQSKGKSNKEEDFSPIAPVVLESNKDESIFEQELEIEDEHLNEIEESYEEEYDYEETNWAKYIIYILPLLLIFGGLYYMMLEKPFFKNEGLVSEKSTESHILESDSVASFDQTSKDTLKIASLEISKPMKYREGRISEQRKYPFEVAAGLFKSKTNADRLLEKMKNAGFDAEIRLVNDMRRVYVGVNTIEEAEAMSNKIEEFTGLTSVYFDENGVSNK